MVKMGQALPCSSGSSELWFASKIFTGEEVVVKKVAESKEVAFERERAVLKVSRWLLVQYFEVVA